MMPTGLRTARAGRPNLRSTRRLRVWQHAKIVVGAEMIHCMVRDISATGAKLTLKPSVQLPETFELYIAAHDLRAFRVNLRWRNRDSIGVSFSSHQAGTSTALAA